MLKIRILHCLQTIYSGGVERRRLSLVKELPPERFEHKIICTKALEPLRTEFINKGVDIIEVGDFRSIADFEKYAKVRKVIKEWQPHIVHGAVFEGVTMAVFGSVLNRVPILITEETSDPQVRSAKATFFMKVLLKTTDYAVGISPFVCRYLKEKAGVPESKLREINNGVALPRKPSEQEIADVRSSLGFSPNHFIIGSVGRLVDSHKRFSDLIRALGKLEKKYPDMRLVIVGDGPDKNFLSELALQLGLTDKIGFAGFQPDTSPYYANMDVFVLASAHEGFGLVVVEAMLSRRPVIASHVGGIPGIIENKYGLTFPPGNIDEMAERIEQLYLDRSVATNMAIAGHEHALKKFTAEKYVGKVRALYEEAIAKKGLDQREE